ncbi:Interferon-inducible GTPase 5-like [Mactra antiquata]
MNFTFEFPVDEDDAKDVKNYYEEKGTKRIDGILAKKRDQWVNIPIHVAICGNSGTGKSSFINVIRGVKPEDRNGAVLNTGQTTIEPIPYPHPAKHYLKFWDLPQLNSRAFTKDLYLKNINVNRYDYFLIFGKEEFTEDDFWIAEQLLGLNKIVYFVLTHADITVSGALEHATKSKRDPRQIQIKALTAMRDRALKGIKSAKIKTNYVYLITTSDVRKFDFPKLAERMIADLTERKWEAMALTLNIHAHGVIQQKRRALQKRVWIIALLSGLADHVSHIYGLSFRVDLEPVIAEVQEYRRQFGLDDASIWKTARSLDTTVESLKRASAFKTNYSQLADGGLLNQYKTLSVYDVATGINSSFSPILGGLISGGGNASGKTSGPCFGSTYYVLNRLLDMMETDALRLIDYVKYMMSEV